MSTQAFHHIHLWNPPSSCPFLPFPFAPSQSPLSTTYLLPHPHLFPHCPHGPPSRLPLSIAPISISPFLLFPPSHPIPVVHLPVSPSPPLPK